MQQTTSRARAASTNPLLLLAVAVAVMSALPTTVSAQLPFVPLSAAGALASPLPSVAGGSGGFHLDADIAVGIVTTKFVSSSDIIPDLCLLEAACTPMDYSTEVVRATVGLGWDNVALEGFAETPLGSAPQLDWTYGIGGRLDTSPDSWVSFQVRLAYLRRGGAYGGEGGRGNIGLMFRPISLFALYGEAALDVTTVSSSLNEAGTLFSYSYFLGGGARVYFGI